MNHNLNLQFSKTEAPSPTEIDLEYTAGSTEEAKLLAEELNTAALQLDLLEKELDRGQKKRQRPDSNRKRINPKKAPRKIRKTSSTGDQSSAQTIAEIVVLGIEAYQTFSNISKRPQVTPIQDTRRWWGKKRIDLFFNSIALIFAFTAIAFGFSALYQELELQLGMIEAKLYIGLVLLCFAAISLSAKTFLINRHSKNGGKHGQYS